ncbi:helix-turn-helix domain-containing protein [Clostridium butyricum]
MNQTNEKAIFKLKEISKKYDIPVSRLTLAIRQGKLKANRVGKEYIVTIDELYRYLGIETTSQGMERELYIKELENKVKNYEIQMATLKNCISMMDNLIVCG